MIGTILFDLDGTLLQVQMRHFVPRYLQGLSRHFDDLCSREDFCAQVLDVFRTVLRRTDGLESNESFFLDELEKRLSLPRELFARRLDAFSRDGIEDLSALVRPVPLARRALQQALDMGLQVVIATNPVFPRCLIDARLRWAGLEGLGFTYVSSYENSRCCKPNALYYQDILDALCVEPGSCLMVGNDSQHDLSASELGMNTFLLDTWLIRRSGPEYRWTWRGGFREFIALMPNLRN